MPLFIFVSGLFAKKTINRNRLEKILGCLVLYLVMKAGFLAYYGVLYQRYEISLLTEETIPWFMLVLAFYMGITMLFKRVSPGYVLAVSIFLACLAGYSAEVGDFLALSRVIVYYPFYYLGYILEREPIERISRNPALKIAAAVIIVLTALIVIFNCDKIYWLRPLLTGRNSFYRLEYFALWGWLCRLIYYVVAGLVCAAFIIILPERTPAGLIGKIGQQTLGVFVFHYFLLCYILNVLKFRDVIFQIPPFFGIWNTVIFALFIDLVLSIPIFTIFAARIMTVPMRHINRKEGARRDHS